MLVEDLYKKLVCFENVKILSKGHNKSAWYGFAYDIPREYMNELIIAIYSMPCDDNDSRITLVIK